MLRVKVPVFVKVTGWGRDVELTERNGKVIELVEREVVVATVPFRYT